MARGDFAQVSDNPVVANSHFTGNTFHKAFGIEYDVIYPFMDLQRYRVKGNGTCVTFINPSLRKGLRLAAQIARLCPDIPFRFVGDLPKVDEEGRPFDSSECEAANITIEPFTSDLLFSESGRSLRPFRPRKHEFALD